MKKSELKEMIRKAIQEQKPAPEAPPKETPTITPSKPDRDTPRRRRISPPKEAPKTKPKALKEQEMVNKIAKKFIQLRKNKG